MLHVFLNVMGTMFIVPTHAPIRKQGHVVPRVGFAFLFPCRFSKLQYRKAEPQIISCPVIANAGNGK
jgi:hypothetical protein